MKKQHNSYHHGNLRQAVVERARKTIMKSGSDKLSLRECARHIGVDPAAIYQHFKSKDALLEEVARLSFVQLAEKMEQDEKQAGPQPRDKLIAVGLSYVSFATSQPELFSMMFKVSAKAKGGVTRGEAKSGRDPYQILNDAWNRFQRPNSEDSLSPLVLWSAVHGVANILNHGLGPNDNLEKEILITEVCESIINGRSMRLSKSQ